MKQLIAILFLFWTGLSYGQKIGDVELLKLTSGRKITVSEVLPTGYSVVIFNSVSCPYDLYYVERIRNISENPDFKEIRFISVNPLNEESVQEIKGHLSKNNLGIEYYLDPDQQLFKLLKATKTPEVVFFQMRNGIAEILYRGAIDNNPQVADAVSENYLSDALKHSLRGKKISKNYIRPMGCVVRSR